MFSILVKSERVTVAQILDNARTNSDPIESFTSIHERFTCYQKAINIVLEGPCVIGQAGSQWPLYETARWGYAKVYFALKIARNSGRRKGTNSLLKCKN